MLMGGMGCVWAPKLIPEVIKQMLGKLAVTFTWGRVGLNDSKVPCRQESL